MWICRACGSEGVLYKLTWVGLLAEHLIGLETSSVRHHYINPSFPEGLHLNKVYLEISANIEIRTHLIRHTSPEEWFKKKRYDNKLRSIGRVTTTNTKPLFARSPPYQPAERVEKRTPQTVCGVGLKGQPRVPPLLGASDECVTGRSSNHQPHLLRRKSHVSTIEEREASCG